MATVSQAKVAEAFLDELGAPKSPLMVKAVIAWMRAESGTSIRANNPWNMTLNAAKETGIKPCGSWKSMSSGLVFAAFCSPQDGARASARLLLHGGNDWRGYGRVVSAARKNDPIGFLNALAKSAWDGGRYGTKNGGPNKLLGIYKSVGGSVNATLINAGTGTSGSANDYSGLPAWIKQPSHVITETDVAELRAALVAKAPAESRATLGFYLDHLLPDYKGKTVADLLRDAPKLVQGPIDKTDLGASNGLGDIANNIGALVGALFDPRKWLLFLALIAGTALTAYGGANLLHAAA